MLCESSDDASRRYASGPKASQILTCAPQGAAHSAEQAALGAERRLQIALLERSRG
jgi:hypothetical protein